MLTTLVGPDFGTNDVAGIYRVTGPTTATPIADLGEFSIDNPPKTPGASLLVDVEFGRGRTLYALSLGIFSARWRSGGAGDPEHGRPAPRE